MNQIIPETDDLLRRAHRGGPAALGRPLETRRSLLRVLARRRLGERIAARVDTSDMAQLTPLEAHRGFERFLGSGETEPDAWLEPIPDHDVAATLRDPIYTQRRGLRRERPLNPAPGGGVTAPMAWGAGQPTPGRQVIRGDDERRLALALATLPDDRREAVRLRHLEGWSPAEIAHRLDRSPAATAGLIKRGLQALRRRLHSEDQGRGAGPIAVPTSIALRS